MKKNIVQNFRNKTLSRSDNMIFLNIEIFIRIIFLDIMLEYLKCKEYLIFMKYL